MSPTIDATTTKAGTSYSLLSAKRQAWTNAEWAESTVAAVLAGSTDNTGAASGPNGPFDHPVEWTFGQHTYSISFRCYTSQQDADAAAEAFKDAIVAAGGTIVSG